MLIVAPRLGAESMEAGTSKKGKKGMLKKEEKGKKFVEK